MAFYLGFLFSRPDSTRSGELDPPQPHSNQEINQRLRIMRKACCGMDSSVTELMFMKRLMNRHVNSHLFRAVPEGMMKFIFRRLANSSYF